MKTILLADFLSIKKTIVQQAIMSVIVGVIVGSACGNINTIPPMIMFMEALGQGFTLLTLDEQNGWESYRSALPLSRKELINGRMTFVAVLTVAAALLGDLIAIALGLAAPALASLPFFSAAEIVLDPMDLTLSTIMSLGALLVILGLCFTLVAKFGMTKATRFMPLVFVLIFLGIFIICGAPIGARNADLSGFFTQIPIMAIGCGFLVIGIGVYLACASISAHLYESREF